MPAAPAESSESPGAVLLDVGGIFHLPSHEHVLGACTRAGFDAQVDRLDRAHYRGATAFHTDYTGELPWSDMWDGYLEAYATELDVPDTLRADVLEHLHAEFAVAAIWSRVVPGSIDDLRVLEATGVRIGVISNADGTVAARLREQEVLQVGPGIGVPVECVIDSGEVGVLKPDPRIFTIALDALGIRPDQAWYVGDMPAIDVIGARSAGIRPLVIDPHGFHTARDYDTVASLREVATLIQARA
ncbi:MAG: putative hydrolase of the superfamily [Actinomycetota bacterium]|jgi:putative hydrolase of the HAD superfamily|nr:putative hydrolase of the superfamily [Actinomycetota bacterium]